jgi:integrase
VDRLRLRRRFIRESSRSPRREDAKNLLRHRLAAIANHTFIGTTADEVTVDQLLADLVQDYEMKGKPSLRTLAGRKSGDPAEKAPGGHVKAWLDAVGGVKAVNVTLPVLTEVAQRWQRAGHAPSTINKRMASLRRAFNLGKAARKIVIVPTFPHLPEHNARQGFFDWPTLLILLQHLPDDGLRDFIEWAARTGMRKGEIAKLTWAGYDRETGVVRLHSAQAKTGKPRRIVLVGPLVDIITRRWNARKAHPECPFIFHRHGKPVGEFRKAWAKACQATGVNPGRAGFTPHGLRRTGLRNMRRAGVTETVAMAIMRSPHELHVQAVRHHGRSGSPRSDGEDDGLHRDDRREGEGLGDPESVVVRAVRVQSRPGQCRASPDSPPRKP